LLTMEAAVVNNFVNWIQSSNMTPNQAFEQLDVARNGSFNAQQLDSALTRAVGSSPPDWVSRAVIKSIKKRAGSSTKSGSVNKEEFIAFLGSYGIDISEEVAAVESKIDRAEEIMIPEPVLKEQKKNEPEEIEEIPVEIEEIPVEIEDTNHVVELESIEEKLKQSTTPVVEEQEIFDERDFDIDREVIASPAVERKPIEFDEDRLESVLEALNSAKLNKELDQIIDNANREFTLHCHVNSNKKTLLSQGEYKGGQTLVCSFDDFDMEIEVEMSSLIEDLPNDGSWFSFEGEIMGWNKALRKPVFRCYRLL